MRVICDLHLHSRYSLATSKSLDLRSLAEGGKRVGIDLLAAPDFTHPVWREEMRSELVETQSGSGVFTTHGKHFILISEVSCIWRQDGQSRRVHFLIAAPGFEAVDRMCSKFVKLQNLESDGRPIFKISARELLDIVRAADRQMRIDSSPRLHALVRGFWSEVRFRFARRVSRGLRRRNLCGGNGTLKRPVDALVRPRFQNACHCFVFRCSLRCVIGPRSNRTRDRRIVLRIGYRMPSAIGTSWRRTSSIPNMASTISTDIENAAFDCTRTNPPISVVSAQSADVA